MAQTINQPKVTYTEALQSIKLKRRAELGQLQKVASDNNPVSALILGLFFLGLGSFIGMLLPPVGGVAALVGVIAIFRAFKLFGVRRRVTESINDESLRWSMRDHAIEKLGTTGFESLASAVEAQGSYDSVAGWMTRKGLSEAECNVLILTAAVAAEERRALIELRSSIATKGRVAAARSAGFEPKIAHEDPFYDGADESLGMHEKLLRDAEGEAADRPSEGDEISRKIAEARKRKSGL